MQNKLSDKNQIYSRTADVVNMQEFFDKKKTDKALDLKDNFELINFQENDQYRYHNPLTRTISQPQPQPDTNILSYKAQNIKSAVSSIIENFDGINLHRKLERTQSEPLPQQVNASRYKTELCRPFEEAGECKYGEKCQFAHGYHELRNLQRHPKYKTEYCRTFHSVGFCPYGPRCHFVHNADEVRALQQQQQQKQQFQQSNQTNSSSFNNCFSSSFTQEQKLGTNNSAAALPLSPPLSMSTGSDRESPTGSLSLSPTSSITNFPFNEQISSTNSVLQTTFSNINTPPDSPSAPISPVNTSPKCFVNIGSLQTQAAEFHVMQKQNFIKPVTIQGKQLLQKSSSSPIAIIRNVCGTPTEVSSISSVNVTDDARLPVFNQLSATIDNFTNIL
ncbi:protein TIS11-like isoform X2 [Teleopsis dalmanni]|uniref:protein TIS11-like isoform X2 n=1 Tax=Teleopsis dalmanni TaxID=139649 RepID=UPI0018CEF83E|nr:protein TIS11-like isoform X2 [Teleopsis dalmanni]